VEVDGDEFEVKVVPTGYMTIEEAEPEPVDVEGAVKSTMQGMVVKLKVSEGDQVNAGDVVAVVEAMKMENDIQTPHGGVVEKIYTAEGEKVETGDIIMVIK